MLDFSFIFFLLAYTSVTGLTAVSYPDGYIGCFLDKTDRVLDFRLPDLDENNSWRCKELCKTFKYRFSGTEYGIECFCGDILKEYEKRPDAECNMTCPGSSEEYCGGPWRISIYLNFDTTLMNTSTTSKTLTTSNNMVTKNKNSNIGNGVGCSKVRGRGDYVLTINLLISLTFYLSDRSVWGIN